MKFLFFIFPSAIANIVPVLVRKIDFLNIPVDFNFKFKGQPIFGMNKTIRGLFFGCLSSTISGYLIFQNPLFGLKIGFLALCGDLLGSFIKRRLSVMPGEVCFPLDQIDWSVLPLLYLYTNSLVSIKQALVIFIVCTILHPMVNITGYYLKLKKNKL